MAAIRSVISRVAATVLPDCSWTACQLSVASAMRKAMGEQAVALGLTGPMLRASGVEDGAPLAGGGQRPLACAAVPGQQVIVAGGRLVNTVDQRINVARTVRVDWRKTQTTRHQAGCRQTAAQTGGKTGR